MAILISVEVTCEGGAQPFETYGSRKDLVPYLIERHGIDIRRMKSVKSK